MRRLDVILALVVVLTLAMLAENFLLESRVRRLELRPTVFKTAVTPR